MFSPITRGEREGSIECVTAHMRMHRPSRQEVKVVPLRMRLFPLFTSLRWASPWRTLPTQNSTTFSACLLQRLKTSSKRQVKVLALGRCRSAIEKRCRAVLSPTPVCGYQNQEGRISCLANRSEGRIPNCRVLPVRVHYIAADFIGLCSLCSGLESDVVRVPW